MEFSGAGAENSILFRLRLQQKSTAPKHCYRMGMGNWTFIEDVQEAMSFRLSNLYKGWKVDNFAPAGVDEHHVVLHLGERHLETRVFPCMFSLLRVFMYRYTRPQSLEQPCGQSSSKAFPLLSFSLGIRQTETYPSGT